VLDKSSTKHFMFKIHSIKWRYSHHHTTIALTQSLYWCKSILSLHPLSLSLSYSPFLPKQQRQMANVEKEREKERERERERERESLACLFGFWAAAAY
jgi:hypothetical protein